ncbi:ABC transporter C family member 2 [Porphyridium purpureum]|uniref:Probable ATP-dependent transporter ycf16 n=1 Tax=Porphyridium purpureum TaxID=35688 RepID=A0A5J4Z9V1_PORPP|nr:ABC transporter C family member 2 [Porphyridium purpureum]|eukprot:POR8735..scf295_1
MARQGANLVSIDTAISIICVFICLVDFAVHVFGHRLDARRIEYHLIQGDSPDVYPTITCPPSLYSVRGLSYLLFSWLSPVLQKGRAGKLELEDLPPLMKKDKASNVTQETFQKAWTRAKPSVYDTLVRAFAHEFTLTGALKLCNDCTNVVTPLILQRLIVFLQTGEGGTRHGVLLVSVLTLNFLIQSAFLNQYFSRVNISTVRVRAALTVVLYNKSLVLSADSRAKFPSGAVQNLISTDARRVSETIPNVNMLWSCVVQIIVALGLLTRFVGVIPTLAGLATLLVSSPLQTRFLSVSKSLRDKALTYTDSRVKVLNEILAGIKLVKVHAWENAFRDRVEQIRAEEIHYTRAAWITQAFSTTLQSSLSVTLSTVAFAVYALLGHSLDAAVIFPSISLFNMLRPTLILLPMYLTQFSAAFASIDRMQNFLNSEETRAPSVSASEQNAFYQTADIRSQSASFSWDSPADVPGGTSRSAATLAATTAAAVGSPQLTDVTFSVAPGTCIAIIGPTGSGKSTLLRSLLGETYIMTGQAGINPDKSIAFVDQTAFILNGTVRENVLFGLPFDEPKYKLAVMCAALDKDFESMVAGDRTEIGARGVNLSGGQKQRISIARAVYSDAEVYIFDDPLSAVDAHVAQHIWGACMLGALKQKTILIATNQLHLLNSPRVAQIICLSEDSVVERVATFDELASEGSQKNETEFAQGSMIPSLLASASGLKDKPSEKGTEDGGMEDPAGVWEKILRDSQAGVKDSAGKEHSEGNAAASEVLNESAGVLIQKEERSSGSVKLWLYLKYLRAGGIALNLVNVLGLIPLNTLLGVASLLWLGVWSDGKIQPDPGVVFYMGVFVLIGVLTLLSNFVVSLLVAYSSIAASKRFHSRMLDTVLRAPMSWFDATPIGRVLNRFSTDVDRMDSSVAQSFSNFLKIGSSFVCTLGLILYATPLFVFPMFLVGILFVRVQDGYRKGAVELRRLEGVCRSPLYNLVAETSEGLTTIRAYALERRFQNLIVEHMDELNQTTLCNLVANRWLSVRLEFMSNSLIFFIALLAVLGRGSIPPSLAAVVLTYSNSLTMMATFTIRMYSETEQQMASIERIVEYSESPPLPSEYGPQEHPKDRERSKDGIRPTAVVKKNWPRFGEIEFVDVAMRYRKDLPRVLDNVSFKINAGERIGVVGRTGAGKSSLLSALFRLVPLEQGSILIDGVDLKSLPLDQVRSALGIIPQDPFLFSGTIRENLDPFHEFEDEQLWRSLRSCGLAGFVSSTGFGLDFVVNDQGLNLSLGQRQLLSLARALVHESPVLLLDEATAAVDLATDQLIQRTLREELKRSRSTSITIAHRINTILDSDRVLVMDKGRVAEFDAPGPLSVQPNGIFASLVKQSKLEGETAAGPVSCEDQLSATGICNGPHVSTAHRRLYKAFHELREIVIELNRTDESAPRRVQRELAAAGMDVSSFKVSVRRAIDKLASLAQEQGLSGSAADGTGNRSWGRHSAYAADALFPGVNSVAQIDGSAESSGVFSARTFRDPASSNGASGPSFAGHLEDVEEDEAGSALQRSTSHSLSRDSKGLSTRGSAFGGVKSMR